MEEKCPKHAGLLDGYLTEAELAAEFRKNPRTLLRWRKLGIGPPFTMAGITPMYSLERARQWLAAGGTASTKSRTRSRKAMNAMMELENVRKNIGPAEPTKRHGAAKNCSPDDPFSCDPGVHHGRRPPRPM